MIVAYRHHLFARHGLLLCDLCQAISFRRSGVDCIKDRQIERLIARFKDPHPVAHCLQQIIAKFLHLHTSPGEHDLNRGVADMLDQVGYFDDRVTIFVQVTMEGSVRLGDTFNDHLAQAARLVEATDHVCSAISRRFDHRPSSLYFERMQVERLQRFGVFSQCAIMRDQRHFETKLLQELICRSESPAREQDDLNPASERFVDGSLISWGKLSARSKHRSVDIQCKQPDWHKQAVNLTSQISNIKFARLPGQAVVCSSIMSKKALITGITGQDGSYLTELLLGKDYDVYGIIRRSSTFNTERIDHLYQDPHQSGRRLNLIYGDLNDASSLNKILRDVQPDEIYNLGAQSHVRVSFDIPEYTAEVGALGALRLLEAIRETGLQKTRFYQASSSELFGKVAEIPQRETTPFYPRSPYAASKLYAYWITVNYRESYGLFACNGLLFNHESPRRGETFVTRKITRAAAAIKLGLQKKLYLGNLDAKRDWGYAKDFVEAMWLMLQQDEPDDYVIATGETHSVREFLDEAFGYLELDWQDYVEIDPRYFRPAEVDLLVGDASKARGKLGWEPKVTFKELVKIMVDADVADLQEKGKLA